MIRESFDDSAAEETTQNLKGGVRTRPRVVIPSTPPPANLQPSELELLGQLMAGQAQTTAKVATLSSDVATMAAELRGLRRDLELDRKALVDGSSKHAATKASNRLAMLLGTLFTLYEVSAPTLREIWRAIGPLFPGGH